MRRAIYPGSFDPFTNGHLDIALRSLRMFDKLTIAVLKNTKKQFLLSPDERAELIREVVKPYPQIEVETFGGLLADFCRDKNIYTIVRGLRAVSDFDYEHAIYLMNNHLWNQIDTVFLMSSSENSFISSSIVKEVASLGGNIEDQVPPEVFRYLQKLYQGKTT